MQRLLSWNTKSVPYARNFCQCMTVEVNLASLRFEF